MKKTDLYLKPGTYIKSSSAVGDIQGISLENFVVSVLNNPTCCAKPSFIKDGMLMTDTFLSTSLQTVKDQGANSSPLKLSTTLVRVESNLEVAERLLIEADSTVTTQTSSVIQSSTTNANLVIAPNGTGALLADIPDGTTVGGNTRGQNAVDLQMNRIVNTQVALGIYSVIAGGEQNTAAANLSTVVGGRGNRAGDTFSFVGGGASNAANSSYSVVSGGQSNTASTNTHATVVGGQNNTASGNAASVVGGANNISSGTNSVVGNINNISSGYSSTCFGSSNTVSGNHGFIAGGNTNTASGGNIVLAGESNQATSLYSVASGFYALTYLRQQRSIGSRFDTTGSAGNCQISDLIACRLATLNTGATTVLSLDGTGVTNLIIPNGNNRAWNVQVNWVAVVTTITGTATGISVGDVITSIDLLAFKKIGGTSSASTHTSTATKTMVTTPAAYAACAIAFTAGASQEMALTFTGPTFVGGGSVTMRVVARIELTEVAF